MSWTEERVAILSKLWADGLSASNIAAELGGVTRNAVIGKVHRLGLSGRVKPAASSAKRTKRTPRATTYNAKPRTTIRAHAITKAPNAVVPLKPLEDMKAPVSKKLSLVELTERTCKWPDGDPATDDFHFCGCSVKEGSPYCEYHSKMAYQPNADRRRDKRVGNG
ncbi:MAG: GcrA family cell cycle regulator [Pseudomonadota bacterium]